MVITNCNMHNYEKDVSNEDGKCVMKTKDEKYSSSVRLQKPKLILHFGFSEKQRLLIPNINQVQICEILNGSFNLSG